MAKDSEQARLDEELVQALENMDVILQRVLGQVRAAKKTSEPESDDDDD